MKYLPALIIMAFIHVCTVAAQQSEPAEKSATAALDKTDQNEHDPVVTLLEMAVPEDLKAAQSAPSQTKVLVAPSAVDKTTQAAKKTKGKAAGESGTIRFGDGEHGRIPQSEEGGNGKSGAKPDDKKESEREEGDPTG
jgi:hypothetical protein